MTLLIHFVLRALKSGGDKVNQKFNLVDCDIFIKFSKIDAQSNLNHDGIFGKIKIPYAQNVH